MRDAFRELLGVLFYLGPSVTHDVVIHGREHVSTRHPKLIVSNHKREMDSLILQSVVYLSRGAVHPMRSMAFSLREDAFWPGFLGGVVPLPWPLDAMWRRLSVRGPLRFLWAYPMGMLRSRADLPRVEAQLASIARALDGGAALYWAPEGGLSLDGHLAPFRAGLHRIIQATHEPVVLLPANVTYDYMTTGRTRCFIQIGAEHDIERGRSKRELEQDLRCRILSLATLNVGHLAAAMIREGVLDGWTEAEFRAGVVARARTARSVGLAIDGRLTMGWTLRRRLRQFLGYARRQGILVQDRGRWHVRRGLGHPQLRYALNELVDTEQALGFRLEPNSMP